MKLSIIIVSFNTKDLLKKCLTSIGKSDLESSSYEVIVIDNASSDGSVEMINEEWLMVERKKSSTISHQPLVIKLIANQTNLGFAKAANLAAKEAKADFFFFLNPDTELKRGTLRTLIEFANKHPEAGVIGARLLNPDGSPQASVYHLPTILRALKEYWFGQKGAYEKYVSKGGKAVEVEAVTGAAMLVPRKIFKSLGGFDKRYFMYFEDLDLCRRADREGFKIFYLPEAEVTHYHGQSAARVGASAYQYLTQSSKIYNGTVKYYLLYLIIRLGQIWQKIF